MDCSLDVILDVRSAAGIQGQTTSSMIPWIPVTLRVPRMTEFNLVFAGVHQ